MPVTHLLSPSDIIWKALEDYGFDANEIFLTEGITHEMIMKPGLRIPHKKVEHLWRRMTELITDPCFGIHAAKFWHPSHFNALGYAWLASTTLREAFHRASRYAKIVGCDRETRLEEKDNEIVIILSDALKLPLLMDVSMSIFLSACRANYGTELNPVGVTFIHTEPDCKQEFDSFFNTTVKFNAETDSIIFTKAVADKQLPTGNKYLAEIHDQYIIQYLETFKESDFTGRVKSTITAILNSGKISDEDVAAKLNVSIRTLQRKLQDHNTNFRSILRDVRQDLATHYIRETTTSLMEIAFILGYSEYTSFSRAYKKWTGVSPGKDRDPEQRKSDI